MAQKRAVTLVVTRDARQNAFRVSRVTLRDLARRYFDSCNFFMGIVRIMNMQEVSPGAIGAEAQ
jgi:hypothetical protein